MTGSVGKAARTASIGRLSLRANFRWTFVGNLVNAASQWGMLAVLAKLGSPEIVGRFALGLSIAAPVMAFTMLQLRAVQVTDAKGEHAFADYFGLRIALAAAGLLIIAAWAVLGGYHAEALWVIVWIGVLKCMDSASDIVRGLFQRHERMDISGTSMMLKGPAALLALATVMRLTGNIVLSVAAMVAVSSAVFVAYDLGRAWRLLAAQARDGNFLGGIRPRFDARVMLRLTWISLPLGLVMFLISFQTNIPRYVLEKSAGEAALGYFAALAYFMVAGTMIGNALGQSASPRLARYFLDDVAQFRRLLRKLEWMGAGLGAAIVAGIILLGRPVLMLLYSPDYAEYQVEFVIIAAGMAIQLSTSFVGYGLTAARSFRSQVVLTSITCLTATVAAFALVPGWGVRGAAVTVLITAVVMRVVFSAAMHYVLKKRDQNVSPRQDQPSRSPADVDKVAKASADAAFACEGLDDVE